MAESSLFLAQEELWVLTWLLKGAGIPGISFENLENLSAEQKNTLRQIILRILWARGLVGVTADGKIQPREQVRRLLKPTLFPTEIYFYGRQDAQGGIETLFFVRRGETRVAYSMLKPLIYYFVSLTNPGQMLQIIGTALNLTGYEKPPFDFPPFEIDLELWHNLQKSAGHQEIVTKLQKSAFEGQAKNHEIGMALLAKSLQSFEAYHAFSKISRDGEKGGFTLLQSKDYLWVLEPISDKMRRIYLVDGEGAAKKIEYFLSYNVER